MYYLHNHYSSVFTQWERVIPVQIERNRKEEEEEEEEEEEIIVSRSYSIYIYIRWWPAGAIVFSNLSIRRERVLQMGKMRMWASKIGYPRRSGQTASRTGRRWSLWRFCRRRRWPWRTGSGRWERSCSASFGPSFLTWFATLFGNPWWRRSGCRRRRRRWLPGLGWSMCGHWWWIWFLLSSHMVPCYHHNHNIC